MTDGREVFVSGDTELQTAGAVIGLGLELILVTV